MQADRKRKLRAKADEVARNFSRTDREKNYAKETFHVRKMYVLSEVSACVVYDKTPTNMVAVAFFYWLNQGPGRWESFFVTYQHLQNLDRVMDLLYKAEQHNFYATPTGENDGYKKETGNAEATAAAGRREISREPD